ncbi:hypothetical protein XINFAN_03172 [Pseudogemmobacter humi]|uniref:Uncharacterized protein n=2 Tax=Pseudogemmobacter humi TaxID=2483812 RepID=A0A3P5XAZ7_9RHOB|nr:hypothetical protein XINFAN_03172 [Pseudogemmobacter humi]
MAHLPQRVATSKSSCVTGAVQVHVACPVPVTSPSPDWVPVLQQYALPLRHMTIRHIKLRLKKMGLPASVRREKVRKFLHLAGLEPLSH